jgi:hypothetical protein
MSPMSGPVSLKLNVAREEISRVLANPDDQDVCLKRITSAHVAMLRWAKDNTE